MKELDRACRIIRSTANKNGVIRLYSSNACRHIAYTLSNYPISICRVIEISGKTAAVNLSDINIDSDCAIIVSADVKDQNAINIATELKLIGVPSVIITDYPGIPLVGLGTAKLKINHSSENISADCLGLLFTAIGSVVLQTAIKNTS
ncbi:MAG: hypothetical protein GX660_27880 [Clostridiaceae bacterium]|nr:hypothetical protein [Clostridiaceae bacterium]